MIYENTKNQSNMKNLKVLFTVLCVACATAVWGESIEINTSNSGVTGSYANNTFTISNVQFGYTQWMKNTNIQAKKSTTNSCYNVEAIPGTITKITVVQTGTARAIKMFGGTTAKPTSSITSPSTALTMVFDFSDKGYTYFSITTPSNACYFQTITIEYESIGSTETTVSFSSSSINFGTVTVGETKTQDVSVTINNPTPSVNFSVTGSGLSVSPSSLSQNGIVTVTYKPTTAGTLNGILTAYGGGLTTDVTASITATAQSSTTTYYTVTWKVGSDNSQTTQVAHGSKAIPPITPNDNALSCADTFMGWTTAPITSSQSEAPTPLFKDKSPEAITANTTFYAVFATKQNGN